MRNRQAGKNSEILKDDGLLGWRDPGHCYVGCHARNPVALERLLRRKTTYPAFSEPVIWMSSLEQWKSFVPHLHPRVETLLFYHQRPLVVHCREWLGLPDLLADSKGRMMVQLSPPAFHPYLGSIAHPPLAVMRIALKSNGKGKVLDWADHWLQGVLQEARPGEGNQEEVAITYTDSGELLFL